VSERAAAKNALTALASLLGSTSGLMAAATDAPALVSHVLKLLRMEDPKVDNIPASQDIAGAALECIVAVAKGEGHNSTMVQDLNKQGVAWHLVVWALEFPGLIRDLDSDVAAATKAAAAAAAAVGDGDGDGDGGGEGDDPSQAASANNNNNNKNNRNSSKSPVSKSIANARELKMKRATLSAEAMHMLLGPPGEDSSNESTNNGNGAKSVQAECGLSQALTSLITPGLASVLRQEGKCVAALHCTASVAGHHARI
jgi:hypothetical protein